MASMPHPIKNQTSGKQIRRKKPQIRRVDLAANRERIPQKSAKEGDRWQ